MDSHETDYWNKDAEKYRQLADLLCAIAKEHCGVQIDEQTQVRWQEMMGLMTEVDAYVDDRIVPGLNTEEDIVEELESFNRFRGRYPNIAPEELGEDTWRQLEQTARDVVGNFVLLADARSYESYVKYRKQEAISTARLFSDCASQGMRADDAFNNTFLPTLESLSISACMFDSGNDLKDDFATLRASITPSLTNRIKLWREAFHEGAQHWQLLRYKEVRHEIGRAAMMHIERHVKRL